jgi:hypothetical protein
VDYKLIDQCQFNVASISYNDNSAGTTAYGVDLELSYD